MDKKTKKILEKYNLDHLDVLEIHSKKPKYIIVGDNPGKEEMEQGKYFIGPSGKSLANKFENEKLVENFRNESIIFNKTIIHTAKTKDLIEVRKKIGTQNFNLILQYSSGVVKELAKEYKIPVLVFGKSQLVKGGLFEAFWVELNKDYKEVEILVYNHPAYSLFHKEWRSFVHNNPEQTNPKNILKMIGVENAKRIQNTYG